MSEQWLSRKVTVCSPQGLHARPADLFAKLASQFQSSIAIVKENQRADGKSIWDILTLGATQGTELIIEASGPDAMAALDAIEDLFNRNFSENGNPP